MKKKAESKLEKFFDLITITLWVSILSGFSGFGLYSLYFSTATKEIALKVVLTHAFAGLIGSMVVFLFMALYKLVGIERKKKK